MWWGNDGLQDFGARGVWSILRTFDKASWDCDDSACNEFQLPRSGYEDRTIVHAEMPEFSPPCFSWSAYLGIIPSKASSLPNQSSVKPAMKKVSVLPDSRVRRKL